MNLHHVKSKPFDIVIQCLFTNSYGAPKAPDGPTTSRVPPAVQRIENLVEVVLLAKEFLMGPQLPSRATEEIKELLTEDFTHLTGKSVSQVYYFPQGHELRLSYAIPGPANRNRTY